MKKLAKKADAAVLLLHHSGKYYEGAPQGAYKGRGASALGALSRAVYCLEPDNSADDRVYLSCPKVKGVKFRRILLELNPASRWFSVNAIALTNEEPDTSYKKVVKFVCDAGRTVKRAEIESALEIDDSTLTRILKKAVEETNDLEKDGHGKYKCSNTQENNQELALNE